MFDQFASDFCGYDIHMKQIGIKYVQMGKEFDTFENIIIVASYFTCMMSHCACYSRMINGISQSRTCKFNHPCDRKFDRNKARIKCMK